MPTHVVIVDVTDQPVDVFVVPSGLRAKPVRLMAFNADANEYILYVEITDGANTQLATVPIRIPASSNTTIDLVSLDASSDDTTIRKFTARLNTAPTTPVKVAFEIEEL